MKKIAEQRRGLELTQLKVQFLFKKTNDRLRYFSLLLDNRIDIERFASREAASPG